jgi:integrase
MGTLFKRGEQWVAQFFDGAGDRRQVSTKTSDRRAAERILAKLEAEAALRREGVIDARADGFATGERTPLATHVENYLAHCQAAGMDELHVENKRLHLARFRDDSKLLRLSEVTAEAVSRFLRSLTVPKLNDAKATVRKAVSARTVNAHRADIIAFIAWTERNGLTPDKRLSGLVPKLDENADRRKVRRALTSEELGRLIGVAEGRGRAAWYLAAIHAGLRRGDLVGLTWGDIDFAAASLTIRDGKSKRTDVLPMHEQLAAALKAMRPTNALPSARVFPVAVTNEDRRADFVEAKIPLVDAEGRTADLHALRTTLGTRLALQGIAPQLAQRLMRHGDYRTTLKHYTALQLVDTAAALAKLPDIATDAGKSEAQRATGTGDGDGLLHTVLQFRAADGAAVTARRDATPGESPPPENAQPRASCDTVRGVATSKVARVTGLEPATSSVTG